MCNRLLVAIALALIPGLTTEAVASQQACAVPADSPNSLKIEVSLEAVQVDENHQLLFFYLLKNRTNSNYRILDGSNVVLMLKTRKNNSFQPLSQETMRIAYPILLPPKQRQVLMLRDLRRTYDLLGPLKLHANSRQYKNYENDVKAYFDKQWPDFNGFVICEPGDSLRIDLPKGW